DAEPVAAVLLGSGDAQPAALRERVVELRRELVRGILLQPVLVAELPGQLGDGLADRRLILGQLKVHSSSPTRLKSSLFGPTILKDRPKRPVVVSRQATAGAHRPAARSTCAPIRTAQRRAWLACRTAA